MKGKRGTRFANETCDKPRKAVAKLSRILKPDEPRTFREAVKHPMHSKEWRKAIQEEFDSIIRNGTWKLVPRPKGQKVVSSKWVFKYKKDEFGRIVRFKARLVARGYTQV